MKVEAMIHSKKAIGKIDIIEKKEGENYYIVRTEDNVTCTAIFNIFTGLFYADDLYGVIEKR